MMDGYFVIELTWEGESAKFEKAVAWHPTAKAASDDAEGRKGSKLGPDGEAVTFAYAQADRFDITWRSK